MTQAFHSDIAQPKGGRVMRRISKQEWENEHMHNPMTEGEALAEAQEAYDAAARPQDVALLPCPFCGLDVTDDEGCFPLNRERTKWEVRCGNPSCFAHDPCDESRHAAIARWNRRSDAALASAQAREEALRAANAGLLESCRERQETILTLTRIGMAAEARAERLAEALREAQPIVEWAETESYSEFSDYELSARCEKLLVTIRPLLSTNAATQTGETT